MFKDRARITAEGGRGGSGAISFRREKYVPRGGPAGGDGGNGGDVVLVVDPDRRDLGAIQRNPHVRAERGQHGGGKNQRGRDGASRELAVPLGTQVFDEAGMLIADLAHPGARTVLAHGGRGGHGNSRFVTAVRQAPRVAEPGLPAERFTVELRLKLVCDAALLGFPNAGKSSLLRRLSNAEPKVAEYPFTTLAPVLGTLEAGDGRQLVVADVPGLVEGASEGVGLGHEFLAHLERASVFIHVIDSSDGDPREKFHAIDTELRRYGEDLANRPQIVFLNKSDVNPDPSFEVDDARVLATLSGSALVGTGIEALREALFTHVTRAAASSDDLADYLVYRPRTTERRRFRILRTDSGWAVATANTELLDAAEIDRALRDAGARPGQLVEIGDEIHEIA